MVQSALMGTHDRIPSRRGRWGRGAASALLLAGAIASCQLPEAKPPPAPRGSLSLDADLGDGDDGAPFGIVYAGPKLVTADSHLQVVFNRPMRSLLGEAAALPAVTLAPAGGGAPIPVKLRWAGAHVLDLEPQGPVPPATEIVLRVAEDTRAADGTALGRDFTAVLASPRPAVVRLEPQAGADDVGPRGPFELTFNVPVDPAEAARAIRLHAGPEGREAAWPFDASAPYPGAPETVRLTPKKPLPQRAHVIVTVGAGLRGEVGTLGAGAPSTFGFRAFGPLEVRPIACQRTGPPPPATGPDTRPCEPYGVTVELSNAVTEKDFLDHARLDGAKLPESPFGGRTTATFSLPKEIRKPGKHTFTLLAGVTDLFGQTLAKDVTLAFETAAPSGPADPIVHTVWTDHWAEVGGGRVFESGQGGDAARRTAIQLQRALHVSGKGLSSFDLVRAPLDEDALLEVLGVIDREQAGGALGQSGFAALAALSGATTETRRPGPTERATGTFDVRVPLDGFVTARSARAAGVVAVQFDTPGGKEAHAAVASVTDLAITGRLSRFGSVVWITELSTGKPVAGADVRVERLGTSPRKALFSTKTDGAGLASLPAGAVPFLPDGEADPKGVLLARRSPDWTFQPARSNSIYNSYASWSDGGMDGSADALAVVLADRGIYRPGEMVHVKGYVRRTAPGATPVPRGERVTVTVTVGDRASEHAAQLDDFGAFTLDHSLPADMPLGWVSVGVRMAGEGAIELAQTTVLVARFRPADMAVRVATPSEEMTPGAQGPGPVSAPFGVHAEYLFGGAVRQGKVRWSAQVGAADWPAAPPDLAFGPDEAGYRGSYRPRWSSGGKGALDATGTFQGAVEIPPQASPVEVEIEAEVEDATRQTVSHRARALVHLTDVYVGIASPGRMARGEPSRIEVGAFDTAGHPRKGVPIHVELRSLAAGAASTACDVVSDEHLVGCSLTPAGAGDFGIVAAAEDTRHRPTRSGRRVRVVEPPPPPSVTVAGTPDPQEAEEQWGGTLDPVADRDTYEVGDTAEITFDSPFPEAEMLLTVEREGVLRHERRTLRGRAQKIRVPVTEDMIPNAFVALQIHQGWQKGGPLHDEAIGDAMWTTAPGHREASVELQVDPRTRALTLGIDAHPVNRDGSTGAAARTFGPGDTVEAEITVRDHKGSPRRGQLTFWAVDEGVLMLTGYEPPDPQGTFLAPRPWMVFGVESRDGLGTPSSDLLGGVGVGLGGIGLAGGGLAPDAPRTDFRPTAFFSGALAIGDDGKARARFALPGSLTRFRLMAIAVSDDDRFGSAQTDITVGRPLVIRPAAPRALRAGDRPEIAAIVTAPTLAGKEVTVTLAAGGLALSGAAKRTVTLPASGTAEVRWAAEARAAGTAKLTFSASGGGARDAVAVSVPVRIPAVVESVAVSGSTTGRAVEQIGDLSLVRGDTGGLTVRVGRGDLTSLGEGMRDLVEYPHGCTEQITSRLVPLLPLASLAGKLGVDMPRELPAEVDRAVKKLASHQRPDGSFGYWPDDATTRSPWLTAYALFGLDLARRHGRSVPEGAIDRAAASVGRALRGDAGGASLLERAFLVDVLAGVDRADADAMARLVDQRAALSLFGRALLAHALVTAGKDRAAARALLDDAGAKLRVLSPAAVVIDDPSDGDHAALFPSEARATAAVLRALLAIDEKDPLIGRLARGLLALRQRGGGWRSTHEAAWALLALDDYGKTSAAATTGRFDATVTLGDTPLLTASLGGASGPGSSPADAAVAATRTLSMAELLRMGGGRLTFSREGEGALFYEARLRYARKELPAAPAERGLVVERSVRAVTPDTLKDALRTPGDTVSTVKAGALVLVEVLVATPAARDQILVEDPLPAGLEPIDPDLVTSARDLALGDADERHLHRELHDDRVLTFTGAMPAGLHAYRYLARATTIGTFVAPPARAEAMYDPGVNGRTGASSLTVTP